MTTLRNRQVLENPQEKEKVSTKAIQSPIVVYEKDNQEKNPNPNKENEKKKTQGE